MYLARKTLSEIGCTFDIRDLDDQEIEAYLLIANKISEFREEELNKHAPRR